MISLCVHLLNMTQNRVLCKLIQEYIDYLHMWSTILFCQYKYVSSIFRFEYYFIFTWECCRRRIICVYLSIQYLFRQAIKKKQSSGIRTKLCVDTYSETFPIFQISLMAGETQDEFSLNFGKYTYVCIRIHFLFNWVTPSWNFLDV